MMEQLDLLRQQKEDAEQELLEERNKNGDVNELLRQEREDMKP